jgi:hypothetical protein
MPRIRAIVAVGFATSLAVACHEPAAPGDTFELPEPDRSLDPERLRVGDYLATPCAFGAYGNGLAHLRVRHDRALVDIFFGQTAARPQAEPTWKDVALVAAHGGRVLYRFKVPAVRARIVLSRIPDLVSPRRWVTVREVPDSTRYDVPLTLGFSRPLQSSDIELISNLGGRVDLRLDLINAVSVVVPDRSIPVLRERADVTYLHVDGVMCAGFLRTARGGA